MSCSPLRTLALLALVLALAALSLATARSSSAAPLQAGSPADPRLALHVLAGLNSVRAQHRLRRLTLSPALSAAAAEHTREMAARGYFGHSSADGSPFWKRIERSYGPRPAATWSVGENLLWSAPDIDAAGALRLWMASPEHRANILAPAFREIGIAAAHAEAAPSAYHGQPVTIVTTDFGVR